MLVAILVGACSSSTPSAQAPAATTQPAYPDDSTIHMNQVQQLGSHNSYHIAPDKKLADGLNSYIPGLTKAWEYTHAPLDQQFQNEGVRQIELDVQVDPNGGLYDTRHANSFVGLPSESGIPEMKQPGLKVLHLHDVDYQTNCPTFVLCLQTVKTWSDANPGHVPIMILVEAKADEVPDPLNMGFTKPLPFDKVGLDEIDKEIRQVFPPEAIITPDEVRGSHKTLNDAVTTEGWPTLAKSRGRVLFSLDNSDLAKDYADGHPSLQGRLLFTNAEPGTPESAFVERNDPKGKVEEIQGLVKQGYLVRARADADTMQARANDTSDRDAAIESGAQYVSTDYAIPDPAFGTGFVVKIPGGTPARCNPVNAPPNCTAAKLEDPAHLKA